MKRIHRRGMVVATACALALSASAFAQQKGGRTVEDTLVYKDPTVAQSGKWILGGSLEAFYVYGPYRQYSNSGDGQIEKGTIRNWKPGGTLIVGYSDITVSYTYRKGNENVTDLQHTATTQTPFNYSHSLTKSPKENEFLLRWRLSALDTSWFSPYVYLGTVNVKSTDSDTLNTGGIVWAYNGTQIARSKTTWKGTMGGIGAIIPMNESFGFRVDGGATSTKATYAREDGFSFNGKGNGGRFTGTMYYNISEGWNAQLGGRYEYLNGGAAGSKYRSGVFAMIGYTGRF